MQVIKQHKLWAAVLVVLLALCALVVAHSQGWAADKGGPVYRAEAAAASPSHAWNGCGGGLHGGALIGRISVANVGMDQTAENFGAHVVCDLQLGTGTGALVLGLEGNADTVWGDLHDSGVNWAWGAELRAGVLVTPSTLLYGHGGWRRVELDSNKVGQSSIDGWLAGAGIEVRLPTAVPLFLDTRYTYASYDSPVGGIDVSSHEVRLGLTWKFQALPRY